MNNTLPAPLVTFVFAALLLARAAVQLWLLRRQARCVAQHRGTVPTAFAATIDLPAHQKAADYTLARVRLALLALPLEAAVLLGWTLFGGLQALNVALLEAIGPRPLLQPLALLLAFGAIGALLDVPVSLYQTFVLEQRFGFNRTTWRLWLVDTAKSALLALLLAAPLLALVLLFMQAAGGAWWLWVWALWMGFSLLMMVVWPMWIAPLFNRFAPLTDASLAARLTALMARAGLRASALLVVDGSRRSAHANAYFTGFGAARRVVLFDTLLAQLAPQEIEAVLAHEIGHWRRRHIARRVVALAAMSLAALAALGWLAGQNGFYAGLGTAPNLPASMGGAVPSSALALILMALAAPLAGFFLSPLLAAQSRRYEFEADAWAALHTSAQPLISALLKLYRDNASTLTPDALYARFYYSHPPAAERIAQLERLAQLTPALPPA